MRGAVAPARSPAVRRHGWPTVESAPKLPVEVPVLVEIGGYAVNMMIGFGFGIKHANIATTCTQSLSQRPALSLFLNTRQFQLDQKLLLETIQTVLRDSLEERPDVFFFGFSCFPFQLHSRFKQIFFGFLDFLGFQIKKRENSNSKKEKKKF